MSTDRPRLCHATPHSREEAGSRVVLASLPRAPDGTVSLVADGASLAFWLLGARVSGGDDDLAVAPWHLGGEYRELALKTRCVVAHATCGARFSA